MDPKMLDPGVPGHIQSTRDICIDSTGNMRNNRDPQSWGLE